MKSEDAANEAFDALLKLVNENPKAKRISQEDASVRSLVKSAEKYLFQNRTCNQTIDQVLVKTKVLIDSQEFRKAVGVLLELPQNQLSSLDIFCQETRQHIVAYYFYFALCMCQLGDHEKAIEFFHEAIKRIKNEPVANVKKKIQAMSSQVYEKLAFCYIHHCHYFPEAFSSIKKALKLNNYSNPDLIEDYIFLLIFNRKFKRATELLEQFNGHEIGVGHYLIAYLQKDYFKCLETSDKDESLTALCKENKLKTFLASSSMLKIGLFSNAAKFFKLFREKIKTLGQYTPMQNVDYAICALLNKSPGVTIHHAYLALQSPEELGDLTKDCFDTFDTSSPIIFLNHVKKDVKNTQNGSEKLRPFRNEVIHYHNSIFISLFVRKKMKRDISEYIFKMRL